MLEVPRPNEARRYADEAGEHPALPRLDRRTDERADALAEA